MHTLRALGYVFVRGLSGMRQSPVVQTVAVLTMSVCMLLVGALSLATVNAEAVVDGWGVDVPITVYLRDDAAQSDADAMVARLQSLQEVAGATHVSPATALERLHRGLGTDADVLDGVEARMLPASIEISLAPEASPGFAEALASRLRELAFVEEVALLGEWSQALESGLRSLRRVALGIFILVACACVAIAWSTIRLAVFARRSEVEILRLVGGTRRFVRAPFVIEGAIQGMLGAALALVILSLGFQVLAPHLERGLSLVFAAGALRFFSPLEIVGALGLGGALGYVGARIAVARYVDV